MDFDLAINQAIKQIGQLNDEADSPRVIATLPRRGYRFIADLEPVLRPSERRSAQLSTSAEDAETGRAPSLAMRTETSRTARWAAIAVVVVAITAVVLYQSVKPARPPAQMRMVVLPFQNLTGDQGQDYFADGMTEEMISQLGELDPNHWAVIARTSAVKYKNSGKATSTRSGMSLVSITCWREVCAKQHSGCALQHSSSV